MIRILIADDHGVVRRGLKDILLEEFTDAYIGEASDGNELMEKVRSESWQLIISDLTMPGKNGIEILKLLKTEFPGLPVLIVSMHPEDRYAVRAIRAGAAGYLTKESASDELVNAVKSILNGKRYITPTVADQLAENLKQYDARPPHEKLSDREFDVMKLLVSGKSTSEIATMLSIGITTASTYRARIFIKMNLRTIAELTHYAIEHNLV